MFFPLSVVLKCCVGYPTRIRSLGDHELDVGGPHYDHEMVLERTGRRPESGVHRRRQRSVYSNNRRGDGKREALNQVDCVVSQTRRISPFNKAEKLI